jgi:hypothetical protein
MGHEAGEEPDLSRFVVAISDGYSPLRQTRPE